MINTIKYPLLIATLLVPCLVYGADPSADLSVQGSSDRVRGRPHIANGTLVAEDDSIIRAVHMHVSTGPGQAGSQWYGDVSWWHNVHEIGHFNAVRLLAYLGLYFGIAGTNMDIPTLESQLDIMVANAAQAGMYVIICDTSDPGNQAGTDWSLNTQFWNAIAPRYTNNTNVTYELKNEPDFNIDFNSLIAHENSAFQLIRSAAPSTPIIVWSWGNLITIQNNYGVLSMLTNGNLINYSNAVVGWHGYDGIPPDVNQIHSLSTLMRSNGYPQMMTEVDNETPESGRGGFSAGFALCQYTESQGLSWVWLGGDGFTDAATGITYGNPAGANNNFPISITWPID